MEVPVLQTRAETGAYERDLSIPAWPRRASRFIGTALLLGNRRSKAPGSSLDVVNDVIEGYRPWHDSQDWKHRRRSFSSFLREILP